MPARLAAAVLVLVAVGALALRLPQLDRRYVHTDEAVHAYKFNELLTTGRYVYDPHEYHGPTIYYFALPAAWLSGAHDWRDTSMAMFRLVPVLFGVGLVLLLLLVGDGLGRGAAVLAGVLTAVSPAMAFYSRYYIQETLLVFFTMLVLAAGWRYVRSGRAGWLLLAGAGLGFMQATKETCVIAWGALAAALVVTVFCRPRGTMAVPRRPSLALLIATLLAAVAVSATLLSGFFTNPRGPLDAWRTFATYFSRAGGSQHIHPWNYYLSLLAYTRYAPAPAWSEGLILLLALIGAVAAWCRRATSRLPLFIAVYTVLLTAAYAVIPYKTPWCLLGFLHGMILLAGFGAATLIRLAGAGFARLAVVLVLLTVGIAHLGVQTVRADGRFTNDPRNPYVYAHPVSDVLKLTGYIDRLARTQPADQPLVIHVIVPNCWPLPWYLRHHEHVGYWEDVPAGVGTGAGVVIASSRFADQLDPLLGDTCDVPRYYGLRRDETLVVYVRRDVYAAFVVAETAAASRPSD
ncbi:MAG: TIGR03663 family protein [Phycisphaerae bacterium]|jgi:uncharacterized protein (TIGR03663 family)